MRWREWLGVGERRWKKAPDEEVQPGKTLWDWLQLLIVPAILIGVSFAWSASQARSDNKREDRRSQDATLQAYLDQMSGLMLDRKLLTSKRGDSVRAVARTVTLTTLRRLNASRKAEVVRFLNEAGLIERGTVGERRALVDLAGADLANADLANADLNHTDLVGADLSGAALRNAKLGYADLTDANLEGANLTNADLRYAFGWANLTNANLTKAFVRGADLSDANFTGADLTGASFWEAQLQNADFTGANLEGAFFEDAQLQGAILKNANLKGTNLTNADLSLAELQGANLEDAKGLPKGSP